MAKIYNEIVIDMNPESPTFEETLYEDSFEYSGGDMILAQVGSGADEATIEDKKKAVFYYDYNDPDEGWTEVGPVDKMPTPSHNIKNISSKIQYNIHSWNEDTKAWEPTGRHGPKVATHYANVQEASAKRVEGGATDWGAANISKEMFINPDGTPKTIEQIYNTLDPLLPSLTGDPLKLQIRDMLPKYQKVAAEEKGFLAETRGFAEREAEVGLQKDMYGLQQEAGKMGAQMRGAYGGMGGGMRGSLGGQAAMQKGAGQAYDAYSLARDKAEFTERKGIYALEKEAGATFEEGIGGFLEESWFETPEGGKSLTTDFKYGGRVPSKQTFLDVLNKLPDAKGS